jgi:hypothetical protein
MFARRLQCVHHAARSRGSPPGAACASVYWLTSSQFPKTSSSGSILRTRHESPNVSPPPALLASHAHVLDALTE